MMTLDKEMSFVDKVVTHTVDTVTALKFESSKRRRVWLKLHPNFFYDTELRRWTHIYEEAYHQWKQAQDDEQGRKDVQQQGTQEPVEGSTDTGEDVPSTTAADND